MRGVLLFGFFREPLERLQNKKKNTVKQLEGVAVVVWLLEFDLARKRVLGERGREKEKRERGGGREKKRKKEKKATSHSLPSPLEEEEGKNHSSQGPSSLSRNRLSFPLFSFAGTESSSLGRPSNQQSTNRSFTSAFPFALLTEIFKGSDQPARFP